MARLDDFAGRRAHLFPLSKAGFFVHYATNMYPVVNRLDILPVRIVIHGAFEHHIVGAPHVERLRLFVEAPITLTLSFMPVAAEHPTDLGLAQTQTTHTGAERITDGHEGQTTA